MDIVYIQDLKIDTTIGVYEWERRIKQRLHFDIEMAHDISEAANNDDVEAALDYSAVSQRVTEWVEQSSFQLIETLVEQLASLLLQEFNTEQVNINVSKPGAVRNAKTVGVRIQRSQKNTQPNTDGTDSGSNCE